jgi:hypothetical protein
MKAKIYALFVPALLMFATKAHADGFRCESQESSLYVQIYNHVTPSKGTRTGAVMVVSDSEYVDGKKTIYRFETAHSMIGSDGLTYTGLIDLRTNNAGTRYDMIMGQQLSDVKYLIFRVDFTYANPIKHGDKVDGTLIVVKRSKEQISEEFECTRYLKQK